ncbi:DUF6414 family protein [Geodermatophilus sp. URMC 64]
MSEDGQTQAPMRFWDYLYLDVNRLEDYWSRFDQGNAESVREMVRLASEVERTGELSPRLGEEPSNGGKRHHELVRERVLTITAKHSFSRLYDKLEPHMLRLGSDVTIAQCSRGTLVEVTRNFEPSPVTQMLESLFELMEMMQGLGSLGVSGVSIDPEAREAMAAMSLLFRAEGSDERGVPMLSRGSDEAELSILCVVEPRYLLVDREDFDGEMTLLGKVQQQVRGGQTLDLLEYLKVLPRTLRRNRAQTGGLRDAILKLFETWPDELGGAVDPDSLVLHGPAIVVSPLAVYS